MAEMMTQQAVDNRSFRPFFGQRSCARVDHFQSYPGDPERPDVRCDLQRCIWLYRSLHRAIFNAVLVKSGQPLNYPVLKFSIAIEQDRYALHEKIETCEKEPVSPQARYEVEVGREPCRERG